MILDEQVTIENAQVVTVKRIELQHWNAGDTTQPGLPGITYPTVSYLDQIRIVSNGASMASEDEVMITSYARTLMEISKREYPTEGTISVGILGLGTGVLPRLMAHCPKYSITVFEIEPSIINWFSETVLPLYPELNLTIIEGDAEVTLAGYTFDVLVDDINGTPFTADSLLTHVNSGGLLFYNMQVVEKA